MQECMIINIYVGFILAVYYYIYIKNPLLAQQREKCNHVQNSPNTEYVQVYDGHKDR